MRGIYFIIVLFFMAGPTFGQFPTDPEKTTLSLYPNPATTTLWVKTTNDKIVPENIRVYNVIGNQLDLTINKVEDGNFTVEVEDLPSGYYLLVVENKETHFTKTVKFLKK